MTSPQSLTTRFSRPTPPGSIGVASSPTALTAKRTEAGVGAMASWAGSLWFTTYPDNTGNSVGNGLWRMGNDWQPVLVSETNGTHAARLVYGDYLYIGEHRIAVDGTVTHLTGFDPADRIAAWAKVVNAPAAKMWALTMAGKIYSLNADSLATAVTLVADCNTVGGFGVVSSPHYKAAWGVLGRLYIVSNTDAPSGRLGYYDTNAGTFQRFDNLAPDMATATTDSAGASFIEVSGGYEGDGHAYAFGQNGQTGYLYVISGSNATHLHRRFILPLCSQQWAYFWQQEWMRLRMIDTERYIINFHGLWMQLSPFLQPVLGSASVGTSVSTGFPRMEPVGRTIRTTTDFTMHNGKIIMGTNSSQTQGFNQFPNTGASQSQLVVLNSSDDLIMGSPKPTGSAYWFSGVNVSANQLSDPMLARGFDKKCVHFRNAGGSSATINIIGYHGGSQTANVVDTLTVAANSYGFKVLTDGFNVDWLAVQPTTATTVSIWATFG